ncbi:hypothetical protein BH20ACI1_BH20ACI1_16300 [soil metagenome]
MKLRLLAILLIVAFVSSISIVSASSEDIAEKIDETTTSLINTNKVPIDLTGWRKAISGNQDSQTISDLAAFTLLFRFIAGNQDEEAKRHIRSYIKQIGLGKCKTCSTDANKDRGTEQDLNALIEAADDFQSRVSVLDQQASEIKRNNQPSPDVTAKLKQLQFQKEAIVTEIAASLPLKLTKAGMDKVKTHITERVKKNSTVQAEQNSASLLDQSEVSNQSEYTVLIQLNKVNLLLKLILIPENRPLKFLRIQHLHK